MAITRFANHFRTTFPTFTGSTDTLTNELAINASGEGVARRLVIPATGSLEAYTYGARSASGAKMDFGLETNLNGKPSGISYASFTPETMPSNITDTLNEFAISSPPSVVAGDIVWSTFIWNSGSHTCTGGSSSSGDMAVWETTDGGATWSNAGQEVLPIYLKIDGDWYPTNSVMFGGGQDAPSFLTDPGELGFAITAPLTMEISGVHWPGIDVDAGSVTCYLYDDADVERWSREYHSDNWPMNSFLNTSFEFAESFTVNQGEEWKFVGSHSTGLSHRKFYSQNYDISGIFNLASGGYIREVSRVDRTTDPFTTNHETRIPGGTFLVSGFDLGGGGNKVLGAMQGVM